MAEYNEVIKQFKRMCAHGNCRTATGCPMNGCNRSQCRKFGFERPREFEQRVMKWAAEHPEPVYPTWGTWLAEKYDFDLREIMYAPIPADIADKLGIEPKEG